MNNLTDFDDRDNPDNPGSSGSPGSPGSPDSPGNPNNLDNLDEPLLRYILAEALSQNLADTAAAELPAPQLQVLVSCDSTDSVLWRQLAVAESPDRLKTSFPKALANTASTLSIPPDAPNCYVLSAEQTAGRGRLGRVWHSPPGGIYLSLLLAEPLEPARALALPLVSAIAVHVVLATLTAAPLLIKWPNDIILPPVSTSSGLAAAKLAGIRVTCRQNRVVIGIGVNVQRPTQPDGDASWLDQPATWISDFPSALSTSREVAAAALIVTLENQLQFLRQSDFSFAPFRQVYEDYLWQLGKCVDIFDRSGSLITTGTVMGVDNSGYLRLMTTAGERKIAAGDVTLHADSGSSAKLA